MVATMVESLVDYLVVMMVSWKVEMSEEMKVV